MVTLTRMTGAAFALNPDLIERVDHTPDTVITLVDGTKYLVRESLDEVVNLVVDYRARLINAAGNIEHAGSAARASRLSAVPDTEGEGEDAEHPAGDQPEHVVSLNTRNSARPGPQ